VGVEGVFCLVILRHCYCLSVLFSCKARVAKTHSSRLHFFIQASMDLPPDKAKLLKSYDDDKKWELICDQVCSLSA